MILPDFKLTEWAENGGLKPFQPECVNPASVDLRWSGRYRSATANGWSEVKMCDDVLRLWPDELVLLDTLEVITMPDDCCGLITLKSSIGRMGLEHMHAGFFDPGFTGTGTLEMYVAAPWYVEITKEQRIVQLSLMLMEYSPDTLYQGRYQGQTEPTPVLPEGGSRGQ